MKNAVLNNLLRFYCPVINTSLTKPSFSSTTAKLYEIESFRKKSLSPRHSRIRNETQQNILDNFPYKKRLMNFDVYLNTFG